MSSAEVASFQKDELLQVKLALRSWDERGKDPTMVYYTLFNSILFSRLSSSGHSAAGRFFAEGETTP
jgi:hypothetical protein